MPGPLQIVFSGFRLDALKRELFNLDVAIPITRREFDLLWFLASHPKHVFTRSHLIQEVWGAGFEGYAQRLKLILRDLNSS